MSADTWGGELRACAQLQKSGGPGTGHQLLGGEAQAVRNEDPDVSQALKTHLADLTGSSSPLGEVAAYLPSQHGQHSLCPRYCTKGLTFNVH